MIRTMTAKAVQFTPIIGPRGELVHATSLHYQANRTACNEVCSGWIVALKPLNCPKCKAALHTRNR